MTGHELREGWWEELGQAEAEMLLTESRQRFFELQDFAQRTERTGTILVGWSVALIGFTGFFDSATFDSPTEAVALSVLAIAMSGVAAIMAALFFRPLGLEIGIDPHWLASYERPTKQELTGETLDFYVRAYRLNSEKIARQNRYLQGLFIAIVLQTVFLVLLEIVT